LAWGVAVAIGHDDLVTDEKVLPAAVGQLKVGVVTELVDSG
jgi:hypothetical protein